MLKVAEFYFKPNALHHWWCVNCFKKKTLKYTSNIALLVGLKIFLAELLPVPMVSLALLLICYVITKLYNKFYAITAVVSAFELLWKVDSVPNVIASHPFYTFG